MFIVLPCLREVDRWGVEIEAAPTPVLTEIWMFGICTTPMGPAQLLLSQEKYCKRREKHW